MTVAELIALLAKQDPTALVVVNGYEGGFSDPVPQRLSEPLLLNVREPSYEGPHDTMPDDVDGNGPGAPHEQALGVILLGRGIRYGSEPLV